MTEISIYCDGGARGNPGPAASAFIVNNKDKEVYRQGKYIGITTNNQAEYEAVNMALQWLNRQSGVRTVNFYLDSLLVVNQLTGKFRIKDLGLQIRFQEIKKILSDMHDKSRRIHFHHIPRHLNSSADALVNQTLDGFSA